MKKLIWVCAGVFVVAALLAVLLAKARGAEKMPLEYRQKVSELVADYSLLQRALAADNLEQARQASQDLSVTLARMVIEAGPYSRTNLMEADHLHHEVWRTAIDRLHSDLNTVDPGVNLNTLAGMRQYFGKASKTFIPFVEKFGSAHIQKLYVLHCSMAFNNTGADWLQSSEPTRNPYFGSEMLECGQVIRVIEPIGP